MNAHDPYSIYGRGLHRTDGSVVAHTVQKHYESVQPSGGAALVKSRSFYELFKVRLPYRTAREYANEAVIVGFVKQPAHQRFDTAAADIFTPVVDIRKQLPCFPAAGAFRIPGGKHQPVKKCLALVFGLEVHDLFTREGADRGAHNAHHRNVLAAVIDYSQQINENLHLYRIKIAVPKLRRARYAAACQRIDPCQCGSGGLSHQHRKVGIDGLSLTAQALVKDAALGDKLAYPLHGIQRLRLRAL